MKLKIIALITFDFLLDTYDWGARVQNPEDQPIIFEAQSEKDYASKSSAIRGWKNFAKKHNFTNYEIVYDDGTV